MREIMEVVEEGFRQKSRGSVQMPPKSYVFFPEFQGDLRVMPAYVPSMGSAGVKVVTVHVRNREKGLPTVQATTILVDPSDGSMTAVVEASILTSMRTGAAGAIAVRELARRDSKMVAFVGAGIQARYQLLGISQVFPSMEAKAFDLYPAASKSFAVAASSMGIEVQISPTAEECVKDADIVVATTPSTQPVIMDDWIAPGTHINAIGADAPGKEELDPAILKRARIIVDDLVQATHSGEVNVPISKGLLKASDIAGELGDVLEGKLRGRESEDQVTVFDATGLAIEDVAAASLVVKKARQKGKGHPVGAERKALTSAGRNPMILGIDVGGTWTRAILASEDGTVVDRRKFRTTTDPVRTALEQADAAGWSYEEVGVGSIGPLDLKRGMVVSSANAPSRVFSLAEPLTEKGKRFYIANDGMAAAWGEHVYRYPDVQNLVYVTLSSGVGAGAIVNGNLLLGKDGNAHEVGYMVVDLGSGVQCCNGTGFWEGIAGGNHLVDALNYLKRNWGMEPRQPPVAAADVFRMASEGDPACEKFINYWLDVTAAGLNNVAVAYDPELIVVGGSVALFNWDIFLNGVVARMRGHLRVREPQIVKASFGDDETAVGAVAVVHRPPSSLALFGYPRRSRLHVCQDDHGKSIEGNREREAEDWRYGVEHPRQRLKGRAHEERNERVHGHPPPSQLRRCEVSLQGLNRRRKKSASYPSRHAPSQEVRHTDGGHEEQHAQRREERGEHGSSLQAQPPDQTGRRHYQEDSCQGAEGDKHPVVDRGQLQRTYDVDRNVNCGETCGDARQKSVKKQLLGLSACHLVGPQDTRKGAQDRAEAPPVTGVRTAVGLLQLLAPPYRSHKSQQAGNKKADLQTSQGAEPLNEKTPQRRRKDHGSRGHQREGGKTERPHGRFQRVVYRRAEGWRVDPRKRAHRYGD